MMTAATSGSSPAHSKTRLTAPAAAFHSVIVSSDGSMSTKRKYNYQQLLGIDPASEAEVEVVVRVGEREITAEGDLQQTERRKYCAQTESDSNLLFRGLAVGPL